MPGTIRTGTASWSDPGFVADWYPADLPASLRLRWYGEHFNLVEVNSSFYRVPTAKSVARWCDQTPTGFLFDVKLHRFLSRHSTGPELLPIGLRSRAVLKGRRVELSPTLEKAVAKEFLAGIEPLAACGKLGALLLQLSPEFSPRRHQLNELDGLLELLADYPVAVELRNRNWVDAEHLAATRSFFSGRKLTFVMVDGPKDPHFMVMPPIDLVTNRSLAYLRAHGRNASAYVRKRTVAERFDYDYSKRELKEIADRALEAAQQSQQVHVIYNNNKSDYAPRAAASFQQILRKEHPEALPATGEEKELVEVT